MNTHSSPDSAPAPLPAAPKTPLLAPHDPPPFTLENGEGSAPLMLLCDHARYLVPRPLNDLGLSPALLRSHHIAWDIGAACVTRQLARRFDACAIYSAYSRLVIDLNRALGDPTSIPAVSDGVEVPGNADLSEEEAQARAEALFWPYHHAIGQQLAHLRQRGPAPALVAIHSFTPLFAGFQRPWEIGILWNHDPRLAQPLLNWLRQHTPYCIGDNQPYSGREVGFTLEHHAGAAGLPNVCIELRQDLIGDDGGCQRWADIIGAALESVLSSPALYQIEHY